MTEFISSGDIVNAPKILVNGVAKIKDFTMRPKKDQSLMGWGVLKLHDGEEIPCKCWDTDLSQQILNSFKSSPKKCIYYFETETDTYNNSLTLTIKNTKSPQNVEELYGAFSTVSKELQMERNQNFEVFKDILKRNLSETGMKMFSNFFSDNELLQNFTKEQAGKSMHDAMFGGLLNHTTKMLQFLELALVQQEHTFDVNSKGRDLLFFGLAIHDIGKTLELDEGVYTKESVATHRGLGILILAEKRQMITELYDNQFFLELVAIVNQHHGLYEEKPHSVFSYLVHIIDNFEASMTILSEKVVKAHETEAIKLFDYPEFRCDSDYFNKPLL